MLRYRSDRSYFNCVGTKLIHFKYRLANIVVCAFKIIYLRLWMLRFGYENNMVCSCGFVIVVYGSCVWFWDIERVVSLRVFDTIPVLKMAAPRMVTCLWCCIQFCLICGGYFSCQLVVVVMYLYGKPISPTLSRARFDFVIADCAVIDPWWH